MSSIEYFYSAHSSYTYLGSAEFQRVAKAAGRIIEHRPMDLNRVLAAAGSTPFTDRTPAFRGYFFQRELQRWSQYRKAPITGRPTHHENDTTLANCLIIAATDNGNPDELSHAMLSAHWCDDADLADEATVARLAEATGHDAAALIAAAREPGPLERYAANTQDAIERSLFGAPTYVVDGDIFYGQDRLIMVEQALKEPFATGWS